MDLSATRVSPTLPPECWSAYNNCDSQQFRANEENIKLYLVKGTTFLAHGSFNPDNPHLFKSAVFFLISVII